MAKVFPLHLRGPQSRIVDRMVSTGMADTPHEAVETALLAFGKQAGLLSEAELLKALRKEAATEPIGEGEHVERTRRARGARNSRR